LSGDYGNCGASADLAKSALVVSRPGSAIASTPMGNLEGNAPNAHVQLAFPHISIIF
jgi:hypothetical protein